MPGSVRRPFHIHTNRNHGQKFVVHVRRRRLRIKNLSSVAVSNESENTRKLFTGAMLFAIIITTTAVANSPYARTARICTRNPNLYTVLPDQHTIYRLTV